MPIRQRQDTNPADRSQRSLWASFWQATPGHRIGFLLLMLLPLICASAYARCITEILLDDTELAWWLSALIGIAVPAIGWVIYFAGKPGPVDCIVMSIILLIFLGILFPVFKQAREKALQREQQRLQHPHNTPASLTSLYPSLTVITGRIV